MLPSESSFHQERDYVTFTITNEWSSRPASRSACNYRRDVMRGTSEGVANA
jgi:hypothetical protein